MRTIFHDLVEIEVTQTEDCHEQLRKLGKLEGHVGHELHHMITSAYDTAVADGGGSLSGGENQRIAIAQAILKNSPVVVLDEVTAFTDPENEAVIRNSIN